MSTLKIEELTEGFYAFCRNKVLPLFRADWQSPSTFATEKNGGELVGALDVAVQTAFLRFATNHLPDWPIMSEEADDWPNGYPPPVTDWWETERFCVLDPLDGTHNHLMGLSLETVMFSLVAEHRPILSAIFDPMRELARGDGFFVADLARGAAFQYRAREEPLRLRVSADAELGKVMGLLEGSTGNVARSTLAQHFMRSVRRWRSTLGFGQSVTLVASGGNYAAGAAALVSVQNKFTDNVHGVLFTELAGGRVTRGDGNPWRMDDPNPVDLLFTNGHVHDELLELQS